MSPKPPNGFIFLEVLIAMSLVLGVWMTSVAAYQRLALHLLQQEAKRVSLLKESDIHERAIHLKKANQKSAPPSFSPNPNKGVKHASSRVDYRRCALRSSSQSAPQN